MVQIHCHAKIKNIDRGTNLFVPPKAFDELLLLKGILAQPTGRAGPILRHLIPRGAGRNPVVRVAYSGVVHIAAGAYIFFHS